MREGGCCSPAALHKIRLCETEYLAGEWAGCPVKSSITPAVLLFNSQRVSPGGAWPAPARTGVQSRRDRRCSARLPAKRPVRLKGCRRQSCARTHSCNTATLFPRAGQRAVPAWGPSRGPASQKKKCTLAAGEEVHTRCGVALLAVAVCRDRPDASRQLRALVKGGSSCGWSQPAIAPTSWCFLQTSCRRAAEETRQDHSAESHSSCRCPPEPQGALPVGHAHIVVWGDEHGASCLQAAVVPMVFTKLPELGCTAGGQCQGQEERGKACLTLSAGTSLWGCCSFLEC